MDALFDRALETRFDSAKKNAAYVDENGYIRDLMSLVSLYLTCAISYKSACAEDAQAGMDISNLPGTAMNLDEAMSHIGVYNTPVAQPGPEVTELLAAARAHIDSRVSATGPWLHIQRLRELLGLSDFVFFTLACTLACALDRGFERIFASLHGDEEPPSPTLGAVHACYSFIHPEHESGWMDLLNPSSAANRLLFVSSAVKPPYLRSLALTPAALGYILHKPCFSRALSAYGEAIDGGSDEPVFLDGQIREVRVTVAKMRQKDGRRLCGLYGAAGSGKKLTLRKIAAEDGASFLLMRMDELQELRDELIDEITALSLFWGYIPCFCLENADHPPLTKLFAAFGKWRIGVIILDEHPRGNIAPEGFLVTRVSYPAPNLEQALHFWRLFSTAYQIDSSVDWTRIAATYALTPGKIKLALRTAAEMAASQGVPVSDKLVGAAVLPVNSGRLNKIADKIGVFYTWDDLVLGDVAKQMLRDACDRIKYRHLVENEWGFGEKSSYGNGVSILLYGPPGTGKTMSAQVIAGELELPLYRVNLAQIISKYIGETAKNLDKVFNEAKSSNVVLFFDEADALFAKRTDVKNSNDRHANSESSYLLQKIEEYSGISILATNLASNFDEAFRRRINYMINIHMPSSEQRMVLWRNSFPKQAPLSSDVDFRLLADNLEFSGSVIKSAALQAAFFAAGEGAQIGMLHIARAVRRELQKLGKSEPHFLRLYPDGNAQE